MKSIYPDGTRVALEVFCLYKATGEYFDIRNPEHIQRDSITIGTEQEHGFGYFVTERCNGCRKCHIMCPQKCIDVSKHSAVIDQHHCLHCGICFHICPEKAVEKSNV